MHFRISFHLCYCTLYLSIKITETHILIIMLCLSINCVFVPIEPPNKTDLMIWSWSLHYLSPCSFKVHDMWYWLASSFSLREKGWCLPGWTELSVYPWFCFFVIIICDYYLCFCLLLVINVILSALVHLINLLSSTGSLALSTLVTGYSIVLQVVLLQSGPVCVMFLLVKFDFIGYEH